MSNISLSSTLPIRLSSTVIRGFGRGSTDLGIPTANLCREKITSSLGKGTASFEDLPCGIYWGFARIVYRSSSISQEKKDAGNQPPSSSIVYKTAISIGYNPTYGNTEKTVEPHLIAPPNHPFRKKSSCEESVMGDFYDETIRLSLVGYLRPELPFEGLEKLIEAIKKDIVDTERHGGEKDEKTLREWEWVLSNESTS